MTHLEFGGFILTEHIEINDNPGEKHPMVVGISQAEIVFGFNNPEAQQKAWCMSVDEAMDVAKAIVTMAMLLRDDV